MPRKSNCSAPGTIITDQVFPPFVVRITVPPLPLAHTTSVLSTLRPRRFAVVETLTFCHCATADVVKKSNNGIKSVTVTLCRLALSTILAVGKNLINRINVHPSHLRYNTVSDCPYISNVAPERPNMRE